LVTEEKSKYGDYRRNAHDILKTPNLKGRSNLKDFQSNNVKNLSLNRNLDSQRKNIGSTTVRYKSQIRNTLNNT